MEEYARPNMKNFIVDNTCIYALCNRAHIRSKYTHIEKQKSDHYIILKVAYILTGLRYEWQKTITKAFESLRIYT